MSNRGEILSSSDVITERGDSDEGGGDAGGGTKVLASRLWMEPWLQRPAVMICRLWSFTHVKARRVIIELSLFDDRVGDTGRRYV